MADTNVPTVFNDRDNTLDIALLDNDAPISADFVTKVAVNIRDQKYGTLVDQLNSDDDPEAFQLHNVALVPGRSDPVEIVSLKLGRAEPRLDPSNYYWLELIIFSAVEPNGYNWDQFPIAVKDSGT